MLYTTRNFLRLCRRHNLLYKRCNYVCASTNGGENDKNNKKDDFQSLLQRYKEKIMFNSYLEHEKLELGHFKYYLKALKKSKGMSENDYKNKCLPPLPVSLQYCVDKDRLLAEDTPETQENKPEVFQLPFSDTTNVEITHNKEDKFQGSQNANETEFDDKSNIQKWMTNYEYFDDSQIDEESDNVSADWVKHYGTPDPSLGVSNVACGGCGALLHCSDPSIPGYLPSELFGGRSQLELKNMECQRCHFLKQYNIALDVRVQPEEYEKLLQSIRYVKSLVLLMVDLLDYPCSIWPGIVDIVGTDRPIIVVGNKVDLLPGDSIGYLNRVKLSLINEIKKTKLGEANIKYISLISAKTGYGVEDLISAMFKVWQYKGDVFLVGCTNVGKSSLFNALLQSDYCKVQAVDLVKRATVSRWPGTTLHLLKFPINRPSGWKIYERTKRLKSEAKLMKVENEIRKAQVQGTRYKDPPTLMGHIGRSFSEEYTQSSDVAEKLRKLMTIDEKHYLFAKSKWLYDTPGVIHPDQVLSLLSTEELLLTIPKSTIKPQTYYLRSGSTMFIAGLARVDVLHTEVPCRLTVFCSESLPITVTKTEDADEIYETFLGTDLFAVPSGGPERLKHWPGLEAGSEDFDFVGEGPKICCGDLVLSSTAWVAVTAKGSTRCKLRGWGAEGRGMHQRYPSALPYAVNLKGKRIRDTPAYMIGKVYSEQP